MDMALAVGTTILALVCLVSSQTTHEFGPSTVARAGICYGTVEAPLDFPTAVGGCASKGLALADEHLATGITDAQKQAELAWAIAEAKAKIPAANDFWIGYKKTAGGWKDAATESQDLLTAISESSGPTELCAYADGSGNLNDAECTAPKFPICGKRVTCPDITITNSDITGLTGMVAGDSISPICTDNGVLEGGTNPITCLCTGAWDKTLTCLPNHCNPVTGDLVASPSQTTYTENDVISLSCSGGLNRVGAASVTCTKLATKLAWSPDLPSCIDPSGHTPPTEPTISYKQDGLEPGKGLEYAVAATASAVTAAPVVTQAPYKCLGVMIFNYCWMQEILAVVICLFACMFVVAVAALCIAGKKCTQPTRLGKLEAQMYNDEI